MYVTPYESKNQKATALLKLERELVEENAEVERYNLINLGVENPRALPERKERGKHQQNVKTSPGPPRGVIIPLVLRVHPDSPWSIFSVKFQKVWIRMDRSGPGGPQGPRPPLVDQERSGPPWTTL